MSSVRGPNSALTEFLRSQGINANEIKSRYERRKRKSSEQDSEDNPKNLNEDKDEAFGIEDETTEVHDAETLQAAEEASRLRDRTLDDGSTVCSTCGSRFTLTVYSKPDPNNEDQFLCRNCSSEIVKQKKAQSKAASTGKKKQRKKMAAELLDLKFNTPPSLQDICISSVAANIDNINELGNLSTASANGISRILSKNRRLNASTMQLFLRSNITVLEFWDCSDFLPETYNLIPALCPNLQKLVLGMCGQMEDDNLKRIAQLKNLTDVYLDGAFLIRKDAWLEFLDVKGPALTSLCIKSVYRVDAEVMAVLAETCLNLVSLSLERLCQLRDPVAYSLLGNLASLKNLKLVDLEPEAWSDESIKLVLQKIGPQLRSLWLEGDVNTLSDLSVDAIRDNCSNLESLYLVNLMDITNEHVKKLFEAYIDKDVPPLKQLSLERCFNIGETGIMAMLAHSGSSLEELNLNSLKNTTPVVIGKLSKLKNLHKLDVSFIGTVDPMHVYKLSTSPSLTHIFAFGNVRLTGMPLPSKLTVLGTM